MSKIVTGHVAVSCGGVVVVVVEVVVADVVVGDVVAVCSRGGGSPGGARSARSGEGAPLLQEGAAHQQPCGGQLQVVGGREEGTGAALPRQLAGGGKDGLRGGVVEVVSVGLGVWVGLVSRG
ncbi:hypothetical protein E2C01_024251 [Portunus trituberculatus]|uniref:Uncharacterized protein n=1 Tax=Portunus trituberculatus TaxID=210409 RepID=A0A5B7ECD1_PORTR|nr:hypothetical protein [Portunus trituberculatus]